jgi:hypothetical protein
VVASNNNIIKGAKDAAADRLGLKLIMTSLNLTAHPTNHRDHHDAFHAIIIVHALCNLCRQKTIVP